MSTLLNEVKSMEIGECIKVILHDEGYIRGIIHFGYEDCKDFVGHHSFVSEYDNETSLDTEIDHASGRGHDTIWMHKVLEGEV